MYLKQSGTTASLQLSSQRKRDLLEHYESRGEELDRWRKFNAAYHDDDLKFMQFLIPPGKRVLELGCGRGDLLAALKPSYGVGIDFGTATTFDVVTADAHYVGGVIAPGLNISAEALFARAARLPRVDIRKPSSVIGTNTVVNMQAGLYYGYLGLVDGIAAWLRLLQVAERAAMHEREVRIVEGILHQPQG